MAGLEILETWDIEGYYKKIKIVQVGFWVENFSNIGNAEFLMLDLSSFKSKHAVVFFSKRL